MNEIPADHSNGQRVSWSQNGEDIRLWKALHAVEQGTYVDVGGWDPAMDSISRLFYDTGWNGVVIEPVPALARAFHLARPRDTVINGAAGDSPETMTLNMVADSGRSTLSSELNNRYRDSGTVTTGVAVQVKPLNALIRQANLDVIHFMSIDVEGHEDAVLKGLDLTEIRPWIIVVEAVDPITAEPSHESWESLLLESDYIFAHWDGLNRFYVAHEHADLVQPIALPVSTLDGVISSHQVVAESLRLEAIELMKDRDRLANILARTRAERDASDLEACTLREEVASLMSELSERSDADRR
jgi:FkbM family methyltransferase